MKLRILTTATVFGLMLVPLAHAQVSAGLQGNIPFQFQVGETVLPAGEYAVSGRSGSDVLVIRGLDRTTGAIMFLTLQRSSSGKSKQNTELVFHRYGSTYFLREVLQGFGQNGNALLESKAEHAIANQMAALPTHSVELASVSFHLQVR